MGKKKKVKDAKPVDVRKAFKKTAAYKKPDVVASTEQAGSRYRQKLRERQAPDDLSPRW